MMTADQRAATSAQAHREACQSSAQRHAGRQASLAEVAGAELESVANSLAIIQLKGLVALRLLLGGLALCALAVLGAVIALTLAITALVIASTNAGVPAELAFLAAAGLCLFIGWLCRRVAGNHFHRLAEIMVPAAGPDLAPSEGRNKRDGRQ